MRVHSSILILIVAIAAFCCGEAQAQSLSRWGLGRPAAMIDLPADPRGGGVAWAEQNLYSIFPNSWSAEGEGVRVEVARMYTRSSPQEALTEIGRKLGVVLTVQTRGEVSGRSCVYARSGSRSVMVAAPESGMPGGATWAIVCSWNGAGTGLAERIFESIVFEREGRRNWTLRSLGRTHLCAELPFELAPRTRANSADTQKRYELHSDGMSVEVLQQEQGEGGRFDIEKTIQSTVEENRAKPGVKDFISYRAKSKLGDKQQADLVTMSFKEGTREYKIFKTFVLSGTTAIIATITTDPRRTDHTAIADRIFNKMRFTGAIIYGWKPYAVGSTGLYLDLPQAPEPPKIVNGTPTTGVFTGPMAVDVREVTTTAYDPDFASQQMLTILKAYPGHKDVQGTIEKRLIDGLEARLLKTTHKNNNFTNHRYMLLIYAADRFWAVDAIAAENEKDYLERIIESARVQLPVSANHLRQQIGQMGVSLNYGNKRMETQRRATPDDPLIVQDEMTGTSLGAGALLIMEMTHRDEAPQLEQALILKAATSLVEGLSGGVGMQLRAAARDRFPVNIDGIEGQHLVLDVMMGNGKKAHGDFLVLRQGKRWWTAFVLADMEREESRIARAQVLNTIRVNQ